MQNKCENRENEKDRSLKKREIEKWKIQIFPKKKYEEEGEKKQKKEGHDVELKYENKVNSKVQNIHKNISCVTD